MKVVNWEKWQSYRKDRGQPPWIKVYRRLLRNPEWVNLTDAERGQLVMIWLLAADHGGVIPDSLEMISKLCYMTSKLNISKSIELGFLTSNGRQYDAPEAETETETESDMKESPQKFRVSPPHRKTKTTLPDGYTLTNVHMDYARIKGLTDETIRDEFESFCLYHQKHGSRFANWFAAWQTWVRKYLKFQAEKGPSKDGPGTPPYFNELK